MLVGLVTARDGRRGETCVPVASEAPSRKVAGGVVGDRGGEPAGAIHLRRKAERTACSTAFPAEFRLAASSAVFIRRLHAAWRSGSRCPRFPALSLPAAIGKPRMRRARDLSQYLYLTIRNDVAAIGIGSRGAICLITAPRRTALRKASPYASESYTATA
jgi:hypothetical protein